MTTSFADLATVIDQYADNALRTTQNGATAVGATGLRLATPFGFRAGQEIVVDSGDNQETVTIAKALSPPPTLNTTLTAPAAAGATAGPPGELHAGRHRRPNAPTNNGPIVGQPIVLDTGANQEVVTVARHISPLPAGAGAERGAERSAGQGPCRGHGDDARQRDPQRAADEGARDRRGDRQPAAAHLRREGGRAAQALLARRQGQGRGRGRHRRRDRALQALKSAAQDQVGSRQASGPRWPAPARR